MSKVKKEFLRGGWVYKVLTEEYGWSPESFSGDEARGRCPHPAHDDRNPSFSINMETGKFHCFSCDMRGSSVSSLVMQMEGYTTINDAMARVYEIARKYGMVDDSLDTVLEQIKEERDSQFWGIHKNLDRNLLDKYNIGKAKKFFIDKEYISGNINYFKDPRYIYPIYYKGDLIGFQGRLISGKGPKYLTIKLKSNKPFVFYETVKGSDTLVIVEGVRDAIKVLEAGYSALALLNAGALSKLNRVDQYVDDYYKYTKVVVLLDNDEAGNREIERIIHSIGEITVLVNLYYSKLNPDDGRKADPKDATVEEIHEAVNKAEDVFDRFIEKFIMDKIKRYGKEVFLKKKPLFFKLFINEMKLSYSNPVERKIIDMLEEIFDNSIYNYIENINNQAEANDETH